MTPLCPRCPAPVAESGDSWICSDHGRVPALWRAREATYDGFVEHLARAGDFPTYLPGPMALGWSVSDFGVVTGGSAPQATVTTAQGSTEHDGPVEVITVSEEPGVGLGARCAGMVHSDPGHEIALDRPTARVRIDSQSVPMWAVGLSTEVEADRSVMAGEAHGRWLWLVIRPASAIMLLGGEWILSDVSGMGAPLLDLDFGGPPPSW